MPRVDPRWCPACVTAHGYGEACPAAIVAPEVYPFDDARPLTAPAWALEVVGETAEPGW